MDQEADARILILGGTVFLGRHLVDVALARNHQVTLFNRGRHNPELYPQVEKLRGDRDGGLQALEGRRWDAVIDTSGYFPRVVRQSAHLLAAAVDHYTFISTISVYADIKEPGTNEEAPVAHLADQSVEEITGDTYGGLKALCEQVVEEQLPGRALIIRPGLIVGPHDPTDRFTYWPHRVAQGGEVLAPDGPGWPTQIIDARDLAEWTVRSVEKQMTGVYNATGPAYRLTIGGVLEESRNVSGSDAEMVWVDEPFLLESGVQPWSELPLWIPKQDGGEPFNEVSIDRAVTAGLIFRPIAETVRDTLTWDSSRPDGEPLRAGITREREAELLLAWRQRRKR